MLLDFYLPDVFAYRGVNAVSSSGLENDKAVEEEHARLFAIAVVMAWAYTHG